MISEDLLNLLQKYHVTKYSTESFAIELAVKPAELPEALKKVASMQLTDEEMLMDPMKGL
jgi:hypothetical protein